MFGCQEPASREKCEMSDKKSLKEANAPLNYASAVSAEDLLSLRYSCVYSRLGVLRAWLS